CHYWFCVSDVDWIDVCRRDLHCLKGEATVRGRCQHIWHANCRAFLCSAPRRRDSLRALASHLECWPLAGCLRVSGGNLLHDHPLACAPSERLSACVGRLVVAYDLSLLRLCSSHRRSYSDIQSRNGRAVRRWCCGAAISLHRHP